MMLIERGAKRKAKADIFISHSSRDKSEAIKFAKTLNYCAVDVWLDNWELDVGQSLTDEIAKAMDDSKFIAILITTNYNKTVWTKTEYKKALAREQKEGRTVMLPLIVGQAEIPDFLEDKIYIDLREDFYAGVFRLVAMVHGITAYRVSEALENMKPQSVSDVWEILEWVGFEPYIVLGTDDFDEMLKHGGTLIREDYARFSPSQLISDAHVTEHVKTLVRELL